ncbi:MAG: GNAT family N-acyltransferase [Opitutaceae bacterium]
MKTQTLEISATTDRYELRLAEHIDDVRAAQRLRYEVFNLELHEGLSSAFETGLDADEFDDVCDHLVVRERDTGAVVGTYRLQTGPHAAAHHGYYSEREFSFLPFETIRHEMIELGRACVADGHRNQTVLSLLWRGISRYAAGRGARYLVGCSSLTSQDEAAGLAVYRSLAGSHLVDTRLQTRPLPGLRCSPLHGAAVALPVPRLMRAYLALGAKICGDPAIDREFGTIDFLTLLDLRALPVRVLQKFLG